MYVSDVNQQDWDDYAERLTFALNTAQDRVRGDTSFYLVHGWDARSTLEATLPIGSTRRKDSDARRWRYRLQSQYRRAREVVNNDLRKAIEARAAQHNDRVRPHKIEQGSQVWLYLDRVTNWSICGTALFLIGDHAARVETSGTGYRIFPVMHLSKLKLVKAFPDRPTCTLLVEEGDRVDFDEALLPEDSRETPLGFGRGRIRGGTDRRCELWTQHAIWPRYRETTWVDEADLNCGSLLDEFERTQTNRSRFNVTQSYEEASDSL
ncbi:reverse transcriptase [Phytophthora megakarya]|uniref:Reverse transcriptase n=1 Tax=Phytophthora megakarya TaxID=4795 RepID=A0A225VBX7_9STRA|nr:reverse transcriptase [Phytophthora megakarya]